VCPSERGDGEGEIGTDDGEHNDDAENVELALFRGGDAGGNPPHGVGDEERGNEARDGVGSSKICRNEGVYGYGPHGADEVLVPRLGCNAAAGGVSGAAQKKGNKQKTHRLMGMPSKGTSVFPSGSASGQRPTLALKYLLVPWPETWTRSEIAVHVRSVSKAVRVHGSMCVPFSGMEAHPVTIKSSLVSPARGSTKSV